MRNSHMEFTMYLEAERNLKNKIQIGDGKKKRPTKLRQVLLHIGFTSLPSPPYAPHPVSRPVPQFGDTEMVDWYSIECVYYSGLYTSPLAIRRGAKVYDLQTT